MAYGDHLRNYSKLFIVELADNVNESAVQSVMCNRTQEQARCLSSCGILLKKPFLGLRWVFIPLVQSGNVPLLAQHTACPLGGAQHTIRDSLERR